MSTSHEPRQVGISDSLYEEVQTGIKQAQAQQQSGGCGMRVIWGPDGEIRSMQCGGRCGIIGWILGRSCKIQSHSTSDGGAVFSCSCSGGWFDQIFSGN